ncbi:MAG: AraC family transcriptional regulator [Anaerolineae bacterium]|nr:AraC family transcriptional regulator [Anaerolineae bacterium]
MTGIESTETVRYWCKREFDALELLHARYITHSFSRHIHEGYAIGVIEAGAETFYYRGAIHVAPAGTVVVINPGEIHTGQAVNINGWKYRMFYPALKTLQDIASEITGRTWPMPFFGQPVIRDKQLAQQLIALHQSMATDASLLALSSGLRTVFGELILRHAVNAPPRQQSTPFSINDVRRYIETNHERNLSLQELATVAGLSPYHLAHTFRQEIGLPPHQYLIHTRIQRAKELLRNGVPLTDIASTIGFTDQSHFTRQFKRVVGVTPGQYRLG